MAPVETALILGGSFVLGLSHAFEVDHLTAVSAFVATRPRTRDAAKFGAKWAVGHGLSLLILGTALYVLKLVVTPGLSLVFERLVGLALLALGFWTLLRIQRSAAERLYPDHHHHHHLFQRSHGHGAIWMGVLHGVAGTAAFVGQAIVVAAQSYVFVVLYTLAFSLGVLGAMTFFAGALGGVLRRAGRWVQTVLALWACLVGLVWILAPK